MPLRDAVEGARALLSGRQSAYRRLFHLENRDAETVLTDLARFCRAHTSTGALDPLVSARLDGRREVWLRLQNHLQLDDRNLWLLYDGRPIPKGN